MKIRRVLMILFASTLLLVGCSSTKATVTNLNASDFSKKTQEPGVVLIDVRTPAEFSQSHISGAVNIDVEASTFSSDIAKLDKNQTYAVYCHSGRRSAIATAAMARAGFEHLFNLQNGLSDWMSQGMMVVNS